MTLRKRPVARRYGKNSARGEDRRNLLTVVTRPETTNWLLFDILAFRTDLGGARVPPPPARNFRSKCRFSKMYTGADRN